jgi:hypothetical protein
MKVGIEMDGVKVTSHLLHQIWMHIQGSKHRTYLQDKHAWTDATWNSIDWKGLKSGFLSLGPWGESRPQRVCMVGLIQVNRNQKYLQMPLTCISVHDVMNLMKLKNTFWNA